MFPAVGDLGRHEDTFKKPVAVPLARATDTIHLNDVDADPENHKARLAQAPELGETAIRATPRLPVDQPW